MDSYIDITIKPDAEMHLNWLLNAVYTKLHKALVNTRSKKIGVSFPKMNVTLGDALRLHGQSATLEEFSSPHWLGGIVGYCKLSPILPVPENARHRTVVANSLL